MVGGDLRVGRTPSERRPLPSPNPSSLGLLGDRKSWHLSLSVSGTNPKLLWPQFSHQLKKERKKKKGEKKRKKETHATLTKRPQRPLPCNPC